MYLSKVIILSLLLYSCGMKEDQADKDNNLSADSSSIASHSPLQERALDILSQYMKDGAINTDDSDMPIQGNASTFDFSKNDFAIVDSVDIISRRVIELLKQGKNHNALVLLEKERACFYAHPANSLSNEIDLHCLYIDLFDEFYGDEMYYQKALELLEISVSHMERVEEDTGEEYYYHEILMTKLDYVHSCLDTSQHILRVRFLK